MKEKEKIEKELGKLIEMTLRLEDQMNKMIVRK